MFWDKVCSCRHPIDEDPYHGPNQAHGLCFSVKPPTQPPPSLKNIFVALQKDYPDTKHGMTGLLTPWAKQGILLLNTCLTVERGMPQSHANHGWETFTSKVIEVVGKSRVGGVCFLVWGTPAAKRVQGINVRTRCWLVTNNRACDTLSSVLSIPAPCLPLVASSTAAISRRRTNGLWKSMGTQVQLTGGLASKGFNKYVHNEHICCVSSCHLNNLMRA